LSVRWISELHAGTPAAPLPRRRAQSTQPSAAPISDHGATCHRRQTPTRPEGKTLLAILKPGDVIITPKLDRMFRALNALGVLEGLKQQGVSLHMIDLGGDVTGNRYNPERRRRSRARPHPGAHRRREARSEDARALSRRQPTGSFGWQITADGSLEPQSERKALLAMRRMQKEGRSMRTVANTLHERGFAISHQGVKKALTRLGEPDNPGLAM
jgi:putative DNA-invertase from lambdoid prophage Rac